MICLFSLPFKLTRTVVLICSRYVDADSQRYSHKNMLQNDAANLQKGPLPGHLLISSMRAPFTPPVIVLPCFHLLNCKRLLQVV